MIYIIIKLILLLDIQTLEVANTRTLLVKVQVRLKPSLTKFG